MCKVSTFVTGVCVGMVAGALVEVMVIPRPKTRKTAVGKAMQRMGCGYCKIEYFCSANYKS